MEVLFRRAALACWTSIILLAVALAVRGAIGPAAPPVARLHVVDPGSDIAVERAAAILVPGAAVALAPATLASGPQPPGRLLIPSIGVNAQVVAVGLDKDKAMGVPTASSDVGWYRPGVVPGNSGDAVMDGHLDWYDTSRAVFYDLRLVRPGDPIDVQRLDGVTRHFRVTSVHTVAYNATVAGLFDSQGPARLSLITCGGAWDRKLGQYLQRVIVDADLVA